MHRAPRRAERARGALERVLVADRGRRRVVQRARRRAPARRPPRGRARTRAGSPRPRRRSRAIARSSARADSGTSPRCQAKPSSTRFAAATGQRDLGEQLRRDAARANASRRAAARSGRRESGGAKPGVADVGARRHVQLVHHRVRARRVERAQRLAVARSRAGRRRAARPRGPARCAGCRELGSRREHAVRHDLAAALREPGLIEVQRVQAVVLGRAHEQRVDRDDAGAADPDEQELEALAVPVERAAARAAARRASDSNGARLAARAPPPTGTPGSRRRGRRGRRCTSPRGCASCGRARVATGRSETHDDFTPQSPQPSQTSSLITMRARGRASTPRRSSRCFSFAHSSSQIIAVTPGSLAQLAHRGVPAAPSRPAAAAARRAARASASSRSSLIATTRRTPSDEQVAHQRAQRLRADRRAGRRSSRRRRSRAA